MEQPRETRERAPRLLRPLLRQAKVEASGAKLSAASVHHTYGNDVTALQGVSLNVRSGEFVCLLGPSGCGKSTLLQMLAGHVRPSEGQVSIDGKKIAGPGPDRILMFQEPALFPWRTVEGNIRFPLAAHGLSREERNARTTEFIHRVHLDGFEKALPHELSGGMKMRTSLARALAMKAPVLLMDEPFGSLDAQTRVRMHRLLQELWRETRNTIVFVTHDVREALTLGTRVVLMAPRPGRIVQDFDVTLPFPRDPEDPRIGLLSQEVSRLVAPEDEEASTPRQPQRHRDEDHALASGQQLSLLPTP